MTTLHLHSERNAPTGSIGAEGAKNTLGRPKIGLPELLLRETLQNSCDAALSDDREPLRYSVNHRRLSSGEIAALGEAFSQTPTDGIGLADSLRRPDLSALIIADRNTTGLGGPTRADIVEGEVTDFVDLLRNIGQPRDKEFGSGTYGYGKSVLFKASRASTIVVHTHCRLRDGSIEPRLIAAALGYGHQHDGFNMTGRHWWGRPDPDVGAEPLLGSEADGFAEEIGLPSIEGTGTTIAIIDPDFEDEVQTVARRIANAALLYAWPRLAAIPGIPVLDLEVMVDDVPIELPDPNKEPTLSGFVDALSSLRAGDAEAIACKRPQKHLGGFRFETMPTPASSTLHTGSDDEDQVGPFATGVHHTALMRSAHLVINYREGPLHHLPGISWAGVFVTAKDAAIDQAFASSEPPTHDEWNHELLPARSYDKTFVKVAKERIDEAVLRHVAPPPTSGPSSEDQEPLGRLADALAELVTSAPGPRPGPTGGGQGSGARPRKARIVIDGHRLADNDDGPLLEVDFHVEAPAPTDLVIIDATARWAVDDGGSDSDGPSPSGWIDPTGSKRPAGPVAVGPGRWTLQVPQGEQLSVVVDIKPVELPKS